MDKNQIFSCTTEIGSEVLMFITSSVILIIVMYAAVQEIVLPLNRNYRETRMCYKIKDIIISSAFALLLPLMSYMFSQAEQNNPVRSSVILIWMVISEVIRVGVGDPTCELKKSAEEVVRLVWVGFLVYSYRPLNLLRSSLLILCIFYIIFEFLNIITLYQAMDSYLLGKNPKLIHNYMKRVLLEDDLKTTPMNSCDYIVMGEENHDIAVCKNGYCLGGKKSNSEVKITIGRVFQLNSSEDEAFSQAHPDWRDVCLSFALAKILRRRFVNLPLDESGSPKALDFVLKGLIDYIGRNEDIPPEKRIGERNPERVFGVIQDELNFILEFSHTKVPTRNYLSWRLPVDLVGCIIMAGILMYIYHTGLNFKDIDHQLKGYASSDLHEQDYAYCDCIIDICGTWIYIFDQFITGILALSCLYILLLWIQAVSGSKHWSTLRLVKQYIENPAKWNSRSSVAASISSNFVRFENMIRSFLSPNVKNFKPARIHYSIFDIKFRGRILGNFLRWIRKKIPRPFLPTVSHGTDVKEAIFWSLRKSGGQLTDGKTALKSHGMLDHLYQVCQHSESTTETIFIWHIATTLFHYQKPPPQQNDDLFKKERTVALDLSTYCLYLLVCLPELLPEEVEWIEEMCGSMREEIYAIDLSSGRKPTAKNRCNHVIGAGVSDDKSMVGKGAMLAKQLVDYADNGTQVWTMLSEFWAEMMLFIAPSDNVEGHGEVLKEGELITQLWALLTHAGILTRPKASQSWNREY